MKLGIAFRFERIFINEDEIEIELEIQHTHGSKILRETSRLQAL